MLRSLRILALKTDSDEPCIKRFFITICRSLHAFKGVFRTVGSEPPEAYNAPQAP